jgi:hypothetical protein
MRDDVRMDSSVGSDEVGPIHIIATINSPGLGNPEELVGRETECITPVTLNLSLCLYGIEMRFISSSFSFNL